MAIQWNTIGQFVLTEDWQYSQQVTGQYFRVSYLWYELTEVQFRTPTSICLANLPDNEAETSVEFFSAQRFTCYAPYQILRFAASPKHWKYRLAVRQIKLPKLPLVNCELKIEMPSYPLEDAPVINPVAATSKNATTVPVTTTATKLLSTNTNRKGVKFYNPDTSKTVYIDTDNVVNAQSAIEKVAAKNVSIPTINWQGEYWAISSGGTVTLEIEEYI